MILALDTCTERLIVAMRANGTDHWINLDSQGNHARDILLAVERLGNGRRPEVVGVALGPGSFTGVRIGLSTAKGLAAGWSVPLVGLDNLAAMAQAWAVLSPGSEGAVLPLIDARKKKYYGCLYHQGRELLPAADRSAADWVGEIVRVWPGPVVLSGYQGALFADEVGPSLPPHWSVQNTSDWAPGLLDQAEKAFAEKQFLGPNAGPRYLRLSEAEENLRLRQA